MRKILLLLTSVMMALGMAACNGGDAEQKEENTPESAVADFLEAVKAADQTKINEYVSEDDRVYSENTTTDEQVKMLFENITYQVKSVKADEENNTAVVTVDMTNIDMKQVFQTYMQNALSAAAENPDMTVEEELQLFQQAITDNKDNTFTNTVDLEVTQSEAGQWKIKTTDEFNFVLAGGLEDEFFQ